MARFGLIGSSYPSQSPTADSERTMNWYLEAIESGMGKSANALYPAPGTKLFAILPEYPVRGATFFQGRLFAVGGTKLCEVHSDGSVTPLATVANDGLNVTWAANQANQIALASGGTLYIIALPGPGIFTPTMLAPVVQVGFCDGYFIALLNNGNFQISVPLDGTNWPGAQVVEVSEFPENPIAMLIDHREVWFWSGAHGIVYYDSGSTSIFDPVGASAYLENGIAAISSQVRLDNSVFWLDADERGYGIARRANGYNPTRVSNHAVEYQWSKYPKISDAIGYSYQDQGHSFWVLYFPSANATWVYDVATSQWHERGSWNSASGAWDAHHSRCYVAAFGRHLVGDWATGNIYDMSIAYADDNGSPIRRMRITPPISAENEWMYFTKMQIDAEAGLANVPSPFTGPSSSPTGYLLPDSSGNVWRITIDATGLLSITSSTGSAETIYLQDYSGNGNTYQLMVDSTLQILEAVPVPTQIGLPFQLPIATTPGLLQAQIFIGNGLIETTGTPTLTQRYPLLNLSWSDDGGHTYNNEVPAGAGLLGNYRQRMLWRRLGRSRQRIWKITASDPVPWRIIEGDLTGTGFQPTERLTKQYAKVS